MLTIKRWLNHKQPGRSWLDMLSLAVIALVIVAAGYSVVKGILPESGEPAAEAKAVNLSTDAAYKEWKNDTAGYKAALAEQKVSKKPIIVYFYAPWCGYCKNFHKRLLSHPSVIQSMRGYIKVRTYPDNRPAETAMMEEFGATGFPMVYIKTANSSSFKRFNMYGDDGELLPPETFIKLLEQASR